jgi:hypothetical protein
VLILRDVLGEAECECERCGERVLTHADAGLPFENCVVVEHVDEGADRRPHEKRASPTPKLRKAASKNPPPRSTCRP